MNDLGDLETRMVSAMDRISAGVAQLRGAQADGAEVAELRAALEEERTANAQLEERVKALSDGLAEAQQAQPETEAPAEAPGGSMSDAERQAWQDLNRRVVRMRRANKVMRGTNLAMREAVRAKVADPELINQALAAEVEALRAALELDQAETNVILERLGPLLEEGATAPAEMGDA